MDFNAAEIVVLLLLAIVIFGPEKLPELARKTARVLNYVRGIANDARGQLRQELGPEFADLKLSDLNPRTMLSKHVLGAEVEAELQSVAGDLRGLTSGAGEVEPVAIDEVDEPAELPVVARPVAFDPEAT